MYPDLSYFLHDLFGTPVDNWTSIFKTFGLFLVLAILSGAYFLYIELKRKAQNGLFQPEIVKVTEGKPATTWEYISNAIFGFILGFKLLYIVQNFPAFQANPAGVVLSGLGNWLGGFLGLAILVGLKYWESNRNKLPTPRERVNEVYPHHRIGDITIIAAISGVLGAKVFDILEHLPDFFENPLRMLLSGGGLAIYGGLIFGFIAVFWYLKKKNIRPIYVMDAIAPALIISYGVGRLGCQFSGDGDWGIVAAAQPAWWFLPDWLWAFDYPRNVVNDGVKIADCVGIYCSRLVPPVYPTPIYEVILSFIIAGILWALRKRLEFIPGLLFFVYVFLNGVERLWVESIRVNVRYKLFGLNPTQAEIIAVGLILTGIVGGVILWRKYKKVEAVEKGLEG